MLPEKLAEVRNKLKAKDYYKRTSDEDKLLDELNEVDRLMGKDVVSKSASFSETRMTSPPSGRCSCWGR